MGSPPRRLWRRPAQGSHHLCPRCRSQRTPRPLPRQDAPACRSGLHGAVSACGTSVMRLPLRNERARFRRPPSRLRRGDRFIVRSSSAIAAVQLCAAPGEVAADGHDAATTAGCVIGTTAGSDVDHDAGEVRPTPEAAIRQEVVQAILLLSALSGAAAAPCGNASGGAKAGPTGDSSAGQPSHVRSSKADSGGYRNSSSAMRSVGL